MLNNELNENDYDVINAKIFKVSILNHSDKISWNTRYEVDFLFRLLENKINKKKEIINIYDKLIFYMIGLNKRVYLSNINREIINKVCYFLKSKLRNNPKNINWIEIKQEAAQIIDEMEN